MEQKGAPFIAITISLLSLKGFYDSVGATWPVTIICNLHREKSSIRHGSLTFGVLSLTKC